MVKPKTMLTPPLGKDCRHRLALLGSLCFFLSAIEYLIPKPLPFMRIGLANMPLLLALDIFSPGNFFLLVLLKIIGQGIIGGMIFSHVFLFSIAGTLSSALVMFALRRLLGKKLIGFAGLGCAGAMASNSAQLLLARYLVFGPALRYMTAPFLASGLVTGISLGLLCEYFCRRSVWYSYAMLRKFTTEDTEEEHGGTEEYAGRNDSHINNSVELRETPWLNIFKVTRAVLLFITGLLMALIFMFSHSIEVRAARFLFFLLLALFFRKKINLLTTLLFMISIVFFHLLVPSGKVLASLGPLRITLGSLYAGVDKALVVLGLVIISRVCVRSDLRLPGTIGALLGESLRMLELMRERRGTLNRKQLISSIDQLLFEVEAVKPEEPANTQTEKQGINVKTVLLLCAMVLITAGMSLIPHS